MDIISFYFLFINYYQMGYEKMIYKQIGYNYYNYVIKTNI